MRGNLRRSPNVRVRGRAVAEGIYDDFIGLAVESGLGDLIADIREGYEEQSPSGGIHLLVRCKSPKTVCLASTRVDGKWLPLIETRGKGGVAIVAPVVARFTKVASPGSFCRVAWTPSWNDI